MNNKNYYEIYTDESGTSKPDHHMLIGGFIINRLSREKIKSEIFSIKDDKSIKGEIKWGKVNKNNYDNLCKIVDYIYENNINLYYKSIVIDKKKVNNRLYNESNSDIGFYKFYYQLIYNGFCKELNMQDKVFLRLDQKSVNYSLSNLKDILNNGFLKRDKISPICEIIPLDSKNDIFIQIADLITGAIRCQINIDKYPNLRPEKYNLSEKIISLWNLHNYLREPFISTPKKYPNFSYMAFKIKRLNEKMP